MERAELATGILVTATLAGATAFTLDLYKEEIDDARAMQDAQIVLCMTENPYEFCAGEIQVGSGTAGIGTIAFILACGTLLSAGRLGRGIRQSSS